MPATKSLILVAFASGALAIPGLRHAHRHARSYAVNENSATGSQTSAPYPYSYPVSNSTILPAPTGTGVSSQILSSNASIATTSASSSSALVSTPGPSSSSTFVYINSLQPSAASSSETVAIPATVSSAAQQNQVTDEDSCIAVDSTVTVTTEVHITVNAGDHTETPATTTSIAPAAITKSETAVQASPTVASSYSSPAPASISQAAFIPSFAATAIINAPSHSIVVSSSIPVSISSSPSLTPSLRPSPSSSTAAGISSSSSYAAPSPTASSYSTGKRGLAYNDVALTQCFTGNEKFSWAYNWDMTGGEGLPQGIRYIPTLWGTAPKFTNTWDSVAKAAIADGATHLMSFNEPDLPAQANLTAGAAAAAYKKYMQPFAGQNVKLGAPAVTNGGGQMGLTWLSNFLDACADCQVDFINLHWYDSAFNAAYFKSHIQDAIKVANGRPIFVSEFGCLTGSDDDISQFLETVMPWMDSMDEVAGYAYFMVSDGLLMSGTKPSSYGSTYATYSS